MTRLSKAVELAEEFNLTCYDATYLELAEDLGFEFITADERFYRKVVKSDTFKKVPRLLADFS